MHIQIIGVFPEILEALRYGIPNQARLKQKLHITCHHLRDFTQDIHRRIDDRPYGGGPGMVLKAEPMIAAIKHAYKQAPAETLVSYLSPHGKPFQQASAYQLSQRNHLILVAGRYEGIDERVYEMFPHEVWSLGDFILSGGEPAILCMVDAISRLLPGVLGNEDSAVQESFNTFNGWLDHPHYTRPALVEGHAVPPVLQSGNHAQIEKWRTDAAYQRTLKYRPDLTNSDPRKK